MSSEVKGSKRKEEHTHTHTHTHTRTERERERETDRQTGGGGGGGELGAPLIYEFIKFSNTKILCFTEREEKTANKSKTDNNKPNKKH